MTTVGFLGLGRMGAPMASNLVGHVDELLVHDLSPTAVDVLVARDAKAAGSAAALGEKCDIVFLSLPTPPIVRSAVEEVIAGGSPRMICDLSTSGPKLAQELHDMLTARSIASFDAPVSGGIRGAEQGTLAIMVGGPEALWPELEPLLQRIGKPFYLGETPGAGQVTYDEDRSQPATPTDQWQYSGSSNDLPGCWSACRPDSAGAAAGGAAREFRCPCSGHSWAVFAAASRRSS